MATTWVADTEPNAWLTLYTRGNVGEVFPHVISVLTGTLVRDALAQAQADMYVESGALRPAEVLGSSVGMGVFGGYLYLNGSAMRLLAVRMPGMSWRDIDAQVFGDVVELPPYRRTKGDRSMAATIAILRYSTKMLRRPDLGVLDRARADAESWLSGMPDLEKASDEQLLRWLDPFPERQRASMRWLGRMAMLVGPPRGILDRLLDRSDSAPGLVNRIVGGTGDVDSALLSQRLWILGRLVAGSEELSAAFDEGLDGIADRVPSTALEPAMDEFLRIHGHRCTDEYELASLAWVMNPTPVYAAIDRLRHAPGERDPMLASDRLAADADSALAEALRLVPRVLRPMLRRTAHVARQGSIGRERAKDILVLENLGARLVLHELVRRAAARGGPADPRLAFCVTVDELPDFVADPTSFAELIAERSDRERYLNARVPPDWFDGNIPDPSTWPLRADARPVAPEPGTVLTGIAVSGGQATGSARVIVDPADPRGLEPGDVLVCAITDPSWTPLFLAASAVVCDTGAVQSHAAIVARELGIPAVMSVAGITSVVDGTPLHVDGDSGTVRVGAADS